MMMMMKTTVRSAPCGSDNKHALIKNYLLQETAASLYDMSEKALGFDLLKVNVFYSSLMEKTVTDKKDYDMRVGI